MTKDLIDLIAYLRAERARWTEELKKLEEEEKTLRSCITRLQTALHGSLREEREFISQLKAQL